MSDWSDWLLAGQAPVWLLFVGIILLSYLLEDVATVCAATLASQGSMPLVAALLAIVIGIVSGDLGLYALGRLGRKVRGLRYKALVHPYSRALRNKLLQRPFLNLFILRFIPGLRTVGFTLGGFFSVPLSQFLSSVVSATLLWSVMVFAVLFTLGQSFFEQASQYQWWLIPVMLVFLFGVNRVVNKTYIRRCL